MEGDYSLLPPYVTAKDIAQIEKCPLPVAEGRFKRIRKTFGIKRSQKLGWTKYCESRGMTLREAIHRHSKLLRVIIILALGVTLAAFGKRLLQFSCEFFRKHTMIWEEHTENYLKGHTFVTDSLTGETTKQTIEIRKTEPQINVFGKDTLRTDTYINITTE